MTGPSVNTFTSQRLQLNYLDWGGSSEDVLLLIHGMRDHAHSWDAIAPGLCDRWRVIAPDLRGHGDSAWTNDGHYPISAFVFDLVQLLDHLGSPRARLVGHSLGGNVAVRFSGLFPERVERLVAIEGLGPGPEKAPRPGANQIVDAMTTWISRCQAHSARPSRTLSSVEAAADRLMATNARLSSVEARRLAEHGVRRQENGGVTWKFDPWVTVSPPNDFSQVQLVHLWTRITCPTLLIYGAESWATNPAEDGRLSYFRNARVELLPNAGHWAHHDQREAFLHTVRSFLEA